MKNMNNKIKEKYKDEFSKKFAIEILKVVDIKKELVLNLKTNSKLYMF